MRRLIFLPFVAILGLVAAPLAAKGMTEVAIGAPAPANFTVKDASGKTRDLRSIMGKNGAVLVFFRSAKWCPFCQAQLKELKGIQGALTQRGYSLAGLSYDPPATLAGFARTQGIGYTLLSDSGSKVIDAFGLRDGQYAPGSFAYGVPKASIIVIGANGRIKAKMVSADYTVRPNNAAILAAVDRK